MFSAASSSETTPPATRRWVMPALTAAVVLALAVRVAAFFLLSNIDGDAYCYLDKARELRAAILAGNLRPADLFFFWLPLYPLAVTLVSLVFPGTWHLMFVGKLVSAVSGLLVCWLVYRLLAAMTGRRGVALVGALVVALDPWQLLYSSNTMTELPFEALVLGAVDRVAARRWTAASVLLVLAGFVRIEAWGLAALVPVAAFLVERRVRIAPVLLVFVAPAAWLAISHAARGDALAYFTARNIYVAEYLAFQPERRHLLTTASGLDLANLLQGACLPFMVGTAVAAWGMWRSRTHVWRPAGLPTALAMGVVYAFLLGFLLTAWVTRSQPVLWFRYGLIYEPLGVCLTLWWLAEGAQRPARRGTVLLLAGAVIAHIAIESAVVNFMYGGLVFQRQAGVLLASLHPHRVFCDSIVVRVEAGLTPDQSRDSAALRRDPAGFLEDLQSQRIDYLVFTASEASTPVNIFPELARFQEAHGLKPFVQCGSTDWPPSVLIYRVKPESAPRSRSNTRNGD